MTDIIELLRERNHGPDCNDAADEIERLRAENKRLQKERDELWKLAELREHQVIACGVAATHPDPNLTRMGAYAKKWVSRQCDEVWSLRTERDALRSRVEALEKALRELLDAGDNSVTDIDDVAAMLRFGLATDAARAALAVETTKVEE